MLNVALSNTTKVYRIDIMDPNTSDEKHYDVEEPEYVKLNVGGALYQTTVDTLKKEDSMLRAMFSGRIQVRKDSSGWVQIDRNGRHFGIVLDFLRDGQVPLPDCKFEVEQILNEARFYLVQDLQSACESWLDKHALRAARSDETACSIITITCKDDATRVVSSTNKPVIKLLLNRHNNKYSYTAQSDDHFLKNLELFERLAVKFHDRIFFVKDIGSDSPEVCQWQFFGQGILRAQVCCTSIVYATDRKSTKVEFPDSKIYEEAMSILRFESRGTCSKCSGICSATK